MFDLIFRKADHGRMGEQRRSSGKKEGPPTEVLKVE